MNTAQSLYFAMGGKAAACAFGDFGRNVYPNTSRKTGPGRRHSQGDGTGKSERHQGFSYSRVLKARFDQLRAADKA